MSQMHSQLGIAGATYSDNFLPRGTTSSRLCLCLGRDMPLRSGCFLGGTRLCLASRLSSSLRVGRHYDGMKEQVG
jgi:hypothetical protein